MIVQVRDQHSAIFVFGGLDMLKVNNPMYQIYEQYWHEERVILLIHGIFDVQQQGFCIYTLRLCDIFLKINEEVLCVFQTMRVLFLDQDNSFLFFDFATNEDDRGNNVNLFFIHHE